jgi:hypothetical protein
MIKKASNFFLFQSSSLQISVSDSKSMGPLHVNRNLEDASIQDRTADGIQTAVWCAFANFLKNFYLMFNIFSFELSYVLCLHLNVARSGLQKSNIQSRTLLMKINSLHLCYFWMSKQDGPQHRKCFVSKIDLSSDFYLFYFCIRLCA